MESHAKNHIYSTVLTSILPKSYSIVQHHKDSTEHTASTSTATFPQFLYTAIGVSLVSAPQ